MSGSPQAGSQESAGCGVAAEEPPGPRDRARRSLPVLNPADDTLGHLSPGSPPESRHAGPASPAADGDGFLNPVAPGRARRKRATRTLAAPVTTGRKATTTPKTLVFRKKFFPTTTEKEWNDWRWQSQ